VGEGEVLNDSFEGEDLELLVCYFLFAILQSCAVLVTLH